MSLHLPALYHWSPAERRKQIKRRGLVPGCRPTTGSGAVTEARPMICLSPDAATAWALSGGHRIATPHPEWDLWQVHIDKDDEVHVVPFWGRGLMEIRVANRIAKSRLIYLGSRVP